MDDVADAGAVPAAPAAGVVPGLYWGVRESFVRYVLGDPDGGMWGDGGVETDGEGTFRFPVREVLRRGSAWRITCGGELRFTAHAGMLDVRLSSPVLELDRRSGALRVSGPDGAPLRLIELGTAEPTLVAGRWFVFPPLPAWLAEDGVPVFGDAYPAGATFDPVRLAVAADAVDAGE